MDTDVFILNIGIGDQSWDSGDRANEAGTAAVALGKDCVHGRCIGQSGMKFCQEKQ
jgi:hypothetical protein